MCGLLTDCGSAWGGDRRGPRVEGWVEDNFGLGDALDKTTFKAN